MTSLLFLSLEIFLQYPCKEVNSEIGNSVNISNLRGNVCFFPIFFFFFFSISFLSVVSIIPLHLVIQNPQEKIFVFFLLYFFVFAVIFFLTGFQFYFPFFLNRVYASPVLVVKRPSDRFRCFCLSASLYLTDQRHRCIESDGCNAKRLPFNNSWKTGKARFVAFYSSCSMHQSAFFI